MSREVIKYRFNRNHIRIYTIHNPEGTSKWWACPRYDINTTYKSENIVDPDRFLKKKRLNEGKNYFEVKKESPLGFYYIQRQYFHNNDRIVIDNSSYRTINTVSFADKDGDVHILTFYTRFGENTAAKTEDGLRPWEICKGDNSIPNHMLQALWDEVNIFFREMEALNIDKVYFTTMGQWISPNAKRDHELFSVKKEVCEYLFGSTKGIRFQTDMEKLIAHGFDPRYSFRKDKQKK